MKKLLALATVGALAVVLVSTMAATADNGRHNLKSGSNGPMTFAVFGDAPYSNVVPNETSEFDAMPAFINAMNRDHALDLVLFAGDIHSGKQPCTLAYDQSIAQLWTAFHDPLIYTPGDNEWADCHKSKEGGVPSGGSGPYIDYANGNPVANLGLIRQLFFADAGAALGGGHKQVVSQADAFDPSYPTDAEYVENVMWEQSGVLFVSVNIPGGSNNDTDPWYGDPETGAQVQERQQRTDADIRWLDSAFAQATSDHLDGVVILAQADMWDLDGGGLANIPHLVGYDGIITDIANNTTAFGKSVLLFNGDSHLYRSDNPLVNGAPCVDEAGAACVDDADTTLGNAWATHPTLSSLDVPNFHRVVVHGSTFPFEYLRVSVDTKHPPAPSDTSFGPFSWERVQP